MCLTIEQSPLSTNETNKHIQKLPNKSVLYKFYNLTCKSENLIYLPQCQIWKLQYLGKSETTFKICLNNLKKIPNQKNQYWLVC